MFTPSSTKIADSELKIERVDHGLYTVQNAYEGQYEYFSGRPIAIDEEHLTSPTHSSGKLRPVFSFGEREPLTFEE
jgi:hypothetical protein